MSITPNRIEQMIKRIPEGTTGEDRRAAYCALTGFKDGKSARQTAAYYTVSLELVEKWLEFFNLNADQPQDAKKKRGRKSKDLINYVKSNTGKVVTPKVVAEELGISLPTFYNFYNANRGFFKKIKRGEFEIINPEIIKKTEV